jgi:hypothetical protein
MDTLLRKFADHGQQLAFAAFARSAAAGSSASSALAGGHRPGPLDEVLSFLQQPGSAPPAHRSRALFDGVLHDMSVVKSTKDWGSFDCAHCAQGEQDKTELKRLAMLPLPLSPADAAALESAEKAVRKFLDHRSVVSSQCDAVDEAHADTDPQHAVITWDFAQLDPQANVGKKSQGSFHILIVVFERCGVDGGRVFLDFLVQDRDGQKPDIFYVRQALFYLQERTPFLCGLTQLTFVSDTCAGEFRSRFAFAQMAAFQQLLGCRIRLLFKAARHGRGMADAHKGHLSRAITRQLKAQTLMRREVPAIAAQLLSPFPNAELLGEFLRHVFKTVEHHVFVLPRVEFGICKQTPAQSRGQGR